MPVQYYFENAARQFIAELKRISIMEDLISLSDHNSARKKYWNANQEELPEKNGIACPKCGTEMIDVDPIEVVESKGYPMKWTRCPNCGLRRKRIL